MTLYGILLTVFALGIAPAVTPSSPTVLVGIGWLLVAISATATLAIFIARVLSGMRQRQSLAERFNFRFSIDTWRDGDVQRVADLGEQSIGAGHPPLPLIRERLERNRDTLIIVRRKKCGRDASDVAGYIMVYPLTTSAMMRLESGRIRSGFDLKQNDICRTFRRPAALYIAMVYASGLRERGFVLAALEEHLLLYGDRQRPRKVYARAATPDGARLLRQNGFESLSGNAEVFEVTYGSLLEELSR
jgi:hypothetical protein